MPARPAQDLLRTLLAAAGGVLMALTTHTAQAQSGTTPAQTAPTDPVQAAWLWLVDAPQAEDGQLAAGDGPGQAAFDAALPDLARAQMKTLAQAGLAARLEAQLATLPEDERLPLIEYLSSNEPVAAELALLLTPEDDTAAAYRVLAMLVEAHGDAVAEMAPLAAAICVVHDQPKARRVNENSVPLIDAVELFGYFIKHERTLRFDAADTPASMLVFLADTNGTLEELDWARRYRRDANVGNRYKEIEYDYSGVDGVKRVTAGGEYSLQKIRELGGICADQAYFAMTVGKANGVPTCYVSGRGGDVSHAWLGFLEQAGRRGAGWNFEAGRYASFEDVQGKVLEPQTWTRVPDANIGIAGYSTWFKPEARRQSVVLTDAALRMAMLAWEQRGQAALDADLANRQLEVLERAIRLNPGNVRAWTLARDRLASPEVPLKQRERWAREIDQLAGQASPDFAFEMLEPMFSAETNPRVRYNLWDWAASRFSDRKDLPARARLHQVRILMEEDKPAEAYDMARSIFDLYHEGGPVAIEALTIAEQLLTARGDTKAVLELYKWAFDKPKKPGRMSQGFLRQTAWYQVGTRYLELLDAADEKRMATMVRRQLGL